ncbi:hypothetical protein C7M61_001906 [Candidozyma pseudohaemuli]|uniref:Uncharacterized protein n=1 Tax=Candidozyma pseudohaemuli TaxID=418784 RepID=A0A2P7YTL5_9ASCO|nr:hypothetical protein C7M61_001906 [[Candida] pseudohaemulonii]PSK39299.1 hypothetical protein C7M61_001906 [[Candida] pseudohaemulonii]
MATRARKPALQKNTTQIQWFSESKKPHLAKPAALAFTRASTVPKHYDLAGVVPRSRKLGSEDPAGSSSIAEDPKYGFQLQQFRGTSPIRLCLEDNLTRTVVQKALHQLQQLQIPVPEIQNQRPLSSYSSLHALAKCPPDGH